MRLGLPWLAAATTLMLLGALGSTTAAQGQPTTASHVSGKSSGGQTVEEGTQEGSAYGFRGAVYEHAVEWSDPRLPALMRIAENADIHLAGDGHGAVISIAASVRLEGSEGSWAGQEYGLIEQLETGDAVTRLVVLDGSGEYEGLSAILTKSYEDADYGKPVFDGYIIDGDTTPMPDALDAFDALAKVAPEAVAEDAPEPLAEPGPTPAPVLAHPPQRRLPGHR
jgi:hypothetical protein